MFTLVDSTHNNVLYTGLTADQAKAKKDIDRDFVLTADYETTPVVGKMKLDRHNYDFIPMTWTEVKLCRNRFLAASDWRDLPSYAGSDQAAWRTYRQKLRDLPQDYTNVEDIVFPTEP